MKVSIITATFNDGHTIADTLDSVIGQTYKNIEHIIVDGASRDNTLEIIKHYDYNKIVVSEPDDGIYDALNKGLKLATGDIIGVIGADDFYADESVIENVVTAFKRRDTDSLYGDNQYVDPENTKKVVRYWKAGTYKRSNFLYGWMPPHVTFFLKREFYERYGIFRTEFKCSGDYELMLRMLYKYQLTTQYLPQTLVMMRTGGTSTASFKHRYVANMEDRKAWRVNNLQPNLMTFYLKPIRKVPQFFAK